LRLGCVLEDATPNPHAISVYYPFALVELVRFIESDDYADTGEALLVFMDSDGCQVTIRIAPDALEALAGRLKRKPDPPAAE
jgi:hypothetical protein